LLNAVTFNFLTARSEHKSYVVFAPVECSPRYSP